MIIELKKLPDFPWTSPIKTLSEEELIKWADGRQIYFCVPMDKYLVRCDDGKTKENKA